MNDLSAQLGQIFLLIFIFLILAGIIFFGLSTVVYKTQGEFFLAVKKFEHDIFLWVKKHYFKLAAAFVVLVLAMVGIIYFVNMPNRPKVVSAEQFIKENREVLDDLEKRGLEQQVKGDEGFLSSDRLVLIDLRTEDEFSDGNFFGSYNPEAEDILSDSTEFAPNIPVVIYHKKENTNVAKKSWQLCGREQS